MIINVEHDITPGNMKTSFKGVRINKNKIPMLKSYINFASIVGNGKEDTAYEGQRKKKKKKDINVDKPFNGTLIPAETGGQGLDGIPADANYSVDDFKNAFGKSFALLPVSYYTNATDGFNHLNKPIRQTLYAIF